MIIVGLTGGIGSGKSMVADLFAKHGSPVIDADNIARELTQPKQPAFLNIIDHFGDDITLSDGTLDRRKLRDIIFNNQYQKKWLENYLHPLILAQMKNQIDQLTTPYCIAVIPLLAEIPSRAFVDRVLVVDTHPENQIKRVAIRDQMSQEAITAILKSQATRAQRLAIADDVIVNNATIADLTPQVARLHALYTMGFISNNKV